MILPPPKLSITEFCLSGGQDHVKGFSWQLYAQEDFRHAVCCWVGGVCLPCWVFGLRCPRMGSCWVGPGLRDGGLPWGLAPVNCYFQCLCSLVSRSCLYVHWRRPSSTSRWVWPRLSLLFSLGLGAHRPCGHPPRVEFLLPPVLWKSCDQTLLAFKARLSGGSTPVARPSGWEGWCGTQNFHSCGGTSVIYFPVFGSYHPSPSGHEIWFYHNRALLPSE